jgi:hypothetical protein
LHRQPADLDGQTDFRARFRGFGLWTLDFGLHLAKVNDLTTTTQFSKIQINAAPDINSIVKPEQEMFRIQQAMDWHFAAA